MSESYVPLAAFLRPVRAAREPDHPIVSAAPAEAPVRPDSPEQREALRAVRRFRAALADALEAAVHALLPAIARDLLGRELTLADADVAAVVHAAVDRFADRQPLSVRAHPQDCDALAGIELERYADDALQPGDVCVDLRSGTIDSTLAVRLDATLAALT